MKTYSRKLNEINNAPESNKNRAKRARKTLKNRQKDKYSIDMFGDFGMGKRKILTLTSLSKEKLLKSRNRQSMRYNIPLTFSEIKCL